MRNTDSVQTRKTLPILLGEQARAVARQLEHCEHRWWGWVYVVQAVGTPLVKVGWCNEDQIEVRLRHLQNMSPIELRLLLLMVSTREDEQTYHLELAAHRAHGEWFDNTDNVVIGNFIPRHRWEGPMAVPCVRCEVPVYGCSMPEVYDCPRPRRVRPEAHRVRAGRFVWRGTVRNSGR